MSVISLLLLSCTTDDGSLPVDKPAPEPVPVTPGPEPMPMPMPTTVPVPVPTTEPVVPWDCTQARLTAAWELGGFADQEMNLLAPMPGGDMIVVGDVFGDVDFGNGVVGQALLGDDLVVARIQPDGVAVWAVALHGGPIIPQGVAVDAAGRIAVAGSFETSLILDQGTPAEEAYASAGFLTGFVAMLSPTGEHEWVRMVDYGVGSESFDAVAFDAGGTLWAAGTFLGEGGTVSYGQPDAVELTGDSNPNYHDAFLARYDPEGALLGVAWSNAEYTQAPLLLATRPTGGVDLLLSHWAEPTPITDMGGTVVELPGGPSSKTIIRFDASGHIDDSLAIDPLHGAWALGYTPTDLVLTSFTTTPTAVPSWDRSAPFDVPPTLTGGWSGTFTWAGGVGPVVAELVHPYGTPMAAFVSPLGKAVASTGGDDIDVLPDTAKLEILESKVYSDGTARPYAIAWDPTGQFVCGVDIEASEYHDVPFEIRAVALDEAGGLWIAGDYQEETFTYEEYEGGPAAAIHTAANGEETQGFLARWQLWPVPAPVPAP